jgi:glycosyltransferase involved in cell wall biosynthesis
MHILHISSWYPSEKQPFSGNFVKRHIELISENHKCTVLNFISEKSNVIRIQEEIIKDNFIEINIFYPKKNNKLIQLFHLRKAFKKVAKAINDIDLIHGHVILEKGILFLWAKNYFQKRLIISEHASYFFRENYQNLSSIQKVFIVKNIKAANAITCVSDVLKEEINYLFPRKKIKVIPNVIDRDLFQIKENNSKEKIKFLHISTLEKVKNVDKIILAFEKLALVFTDFELKIIAEKQNETIENQLQNSKISNRITLVGPFDSQKIAYELQEASALVHFSSFETFSCVIAEAWSCGIPIVSSPVGIAKNMSPEIGILVPNLDENSLADALQKFCTEKKKYSSDLIRKSTEKYSKGAVAKAFDNLYNQHLN